MATRSQKTVLAKEGSNSSPSEDDGQMEGRRKRKVHDLYNKQGAESAWVLGIKLKLKESTLRSWFTTWQQDV